MTDLIRALSELQEIYEVLGDTNRANAYQTAIMNIRAGKQLGAGIRAKAAELAKTGRIAELERLRGSYLALGKILGVGPVTVKKWLDMGIDSLAKLRRAVGAGRISLTTMQQWGLRYYDDLNTRIPRAEVAALCEYLRSVLIRSDPGLIFEPAGSFRRGALDSGDIDIIVSPGRNDPDLLVYFIAELNEDPNFITTLVNGQSRVTFLYKSPISKRVRQIDILNVTRESLPAALLYFTGSDMFNEAMRGYAKAKGFRLNQNGLFKVNGNSNGKSKGEQLLLINVQSERDIFNALQLQYVAPADRNEARVVPR